MVPSLAPGIVGSHLIGVGQSMGQKGPEVEQLPGAEHSGGDPEDPEFGINKPDIEDVVKQRHNDELNNGNIPEHEFKPPFPKILRAGIIIGIFSSARVLMMQVMVF